MNILHDLSIEILMVLYQSSQTIQTIELFAPVVILRQICNDLFKHFFRIVHRCQLLLRHILGRFVIELMIFFLS